LGAQPRSDAGSRDARSDAGSRDARSDAGSRDARSDAASRDAAALFRRQVLPLLEGRCLGCHGRDPEELEAGLDVRSREGLLAGGDSGRAAIVPGAPEKSPLYVAVTWRDEDLQMPPEEKDRLGAAEIEAIRRWIAGGAPWPKRSPGQAPGSAREDGEDGLTLVTSGGLTEAWNLRRYRPEDLWAYLPVKRHPAPRGDREEAAGSNPIDAFIAARLERQGLTPAPPAPGRTFIRRATLDLWGLPPAPEDIDTLLADDSPDAYGALIDRLLASEHYGEQMARHWLDVVRYADTSGFSNDFERPNAWRYRDYVIRSFNDDKPYDRFVVEQLAGDELDPGDPEKLVAVGFLRMGPWEHTAMSVEAVTRQHFLDDVTHSVGVTFLAQPLRCARCHDHKFDPLPTRDYYRVQAVFAPVQFADRHAPYLDRENTDRLHAGKARTERRLAGAKKALASLREKRRRALANFLRARGVPRLEDLPEADRPPRHFGLTPLDMSLQKMYGKWLAYFQRELKRYEAYAFSVYNGPPRRFLSGKAVNPPPGNRRGATQAIHILRGGALGSPGEPVTPGVLSAVYGSNDAVTPTAWNTMPESRDGRRLAFARWITSAENTLTARVLVNRVWQHHFAGKGIVATPNNFGKMGGRPTHPELLDWLATWFVEHGWSIKKLHRLIMTSAVYRRSSHHPSRRDVERLDPQGDLLAYYPVRRLDAEEIRDSVLAMTGELNREMGGSGVYPEIHWAVALQPRHIMGTTAPAYQPSRTPAERHRRSIYAFRCRTLKDPLLQVFDRPGSDTSCERRDETTVAPQALTLLNGQFMNDRALALARRLEELFPDAGERIEQAFRRVYGRRASPDEIRLVLEHVRAMTEYHGRNVPQPVKPPTSVTRHMVEELTGERFSWHEELDLMKDFQPDLKPWDVGPETRGLAELCLVLLNSNEFLYVR
ncbi:MAG: PSD1 and planctomycete cytochrome C domain-containing protein, partial [Planctomycetota bacterium]|nr:PSD1 and planctomycete cytochrome C domain-containing protein [Planctomycetota bacterium]